MTQSPRLRWTVACLAATLATTACHLQPMSIHADCEAPNRWTWGWTLHIDPGGRATVELKPDEYGEAGFEEYRLTRHQLKAIRDGVHRAGFFRLQTRYGDPDGAIRRTLRVTEGRRRHEVSFTASGGQLEGIPEPLLELWLYIRETFSTYRAHDGAAYIRQYLDETRPPEPQPAPPWPLAGPR